MGVVAQSELFAQERLSRPFLKWAGGKYRVLERILPRLPKGLRLVEPFAGSGVVSLNAAFPSALLADSNADLICLYQTIRDQLNEFVAEAESLFGTQNDRASYEALRREFNETRDPLRRSAIFVYLNRHGFNGLCRYNASGKFNVPFGSYSNPGFPKKEIEHFARVTRNFEFLHADFQDVLENTRSGDVVYCDPPYVPLSQTSNFTSYAPGAFGVEQQRSLAELARKCARRGIPVVISNHDTPVTQELYSGAELHSFDVHRSISSKASTRGAVPELLAIFY